MAVAIIRQLTLAQVQAAIDAGSTSWNNNYAGTQVYVTDKDWHLACYLDRVAKPLSGVLKITNGDTLPNWLVPEILLIDTGTITANIDGTEGNPMISMTFPSGYVPILVEYSGTGVTITGFTIWNTNERYFFTIAELDQLKLVASIQTDESGSEYRYTNETELLISGIGNESPGIQVIVTFKKSYL